MPKDEIEGDELLMDLQPYEYVVDYNKKKYKFEVRNIDWPMLQRIRTNCTIMNNATKTAMFDEEKFDLEVLKYGVIKWPDSNTKLKEDFLKRLFSEVKEELLTEIMKHEKAVKELKKNSEKPSGQGG